MVDHSEGVTKAESMLINKGSPGINHCPQGQQAQLVYNLAVQG